MQSIFRIFDGYKFRYYLWYLVHIIVDDEHIESPTLWYISIDLSHSLDNAKLDPQIPAQNRGLSWILPSGFTPGRLSRKISRALLN
jgi:hypothetical protein